MKYLITGGAGFIGSNLSDRLLSDGHDVVVIDNFNDYYDISIKRKNVCLNRNNPHYQLYTIDIENKEMLHQIFTYHKFDAVIHLAARAGVRSSLKNPSDYIRTNILGTLNVLECIQKTSFPKLVFASSSSVYGNCKEQKFSENLIAQPISPYAMTKLACEELCYTWHHLYNLNIVALRFFTVYGPRQRPDLAIHKFIQKISNGQSIQMYGDGSTQRDYTYIDDIIDGIIAALNYRKTGFEIINLGSGHPITLKRMIQTIEKNIGKKAFIEQIPIPPGDVNKTICDWSKAHSLLNYTPKTTFETGIQNSIKWFRKEFS